MTDDQVPTPDDAAAVDPDAIVSRLREAFATSLDQWDTYLATLPENPRERIAAQPRSFYYDTGDFLTALIGAALVYHSQQQIVDHDADDPGTTAEMSRLGNLLLTGGPGEVEMGPAYSEWLETALTFTEDGRIEFAEMTDQVRAERAAYSAALDAAEAARAEALSRAVQLFPRLWH